MDWARRKKLAGRRARVSTAAASSRKDQRWTPRPCGRADRHDVPSSGRITTAWLAMRRLGYTPQLPIHRAIERVEAARARAARSGGARVDAEDLGGQDRVSVGVVAGQQVESVGVARVSERAHRSGVDAALCARRILACAGCGVTFVWGGALPTWGMRRPSR